MNYGVIPSVIADNEEAYRDCIGKFYGIGIPADRIIIATGTEEAIKNLRSGDMLTILYGAHLYNRVSDVLEMMEQILVKGITLCFYGKTFSIIQPMELSVLQKLAGQLCRGKKDSLRT